MNTTTPRRIATVLLAATAACSEAADQTTISTVPSTTVSTTPVTTRLTTTSTPAMRPRSTPMMVTYEMTPIPETPAGDQLAWFLEAVTHLPIPIADMEQHVAPAVLQVLPPEQLNAALAALGDLDTARYVGVLTTTETSIAAVIEHGSGELSVLTISVDDAGLFSDLQLTPMPLRPRAEAGLEPLQLPAPTGPSAVGTDTIITSGDESAGRTVPVQVWYPAQTTGTEPMAPYAPPATRSYLAQQLGVPEVDIADIRTGATMSPPVDLDGGTLPIVLFAPGFGVARNFYSALAAELASHGYLVAVLDHPGGANLVEYPDGTVVPAAPATSTLDVPAELAIRIADAAAVVDLLTRLNTTPSSRFHDALDLEHIAFTGHSIGGSSAAEAIPLDPRYDVGANLDGTMSDELLQTGLDRPFLLMGSPEQDASWTAFRSANPAAVSVRIEGLAHMSFSDWPALSTLRPSGDIGAEQIGTVDPWRSIAIQRAYLLAFLDVHLRGKQSSLLDERPSSTFPEVTVH